MLPNASRTSGGGPYGFSFASSLIMSSGARPSFAVGMHVYPCCGVLHGIPVDPTRVCGHTARSIIITLSHHTPESTSKGSMGV